MARLYDPDDAYAGLPLKMRVTPTVSVLVASALVILFPFAADAPLWPPLGFMMLIGWRMMRSDLWPVWIGLPLGLFDDLASGQPVGSAMALWTIAMLTFDAFDRRVVWRDHWIDWLIAAAMLAVYLLVGALFARTGDAANLLRILAPQWAWSAMLMPLVMRLTAGLDRWRQRR